MEQSQDFRKQLFSFSTEADMKHQISLVRYTIFYKWPLIDRIAVLLLFNQIYMFLIEYESLVMLYPLATSGGGVCILFLHPPFCSIVNMKYLIWGWSRFILLCFSSVFKRTLSPFWSFYVVLNFAECRYFIIASCLTYIKQMEILQDTYMSVSCIFFIYMKPCVATPMSLLFFVNHYFCITIDWLAALTQKNIIIFNLICLQ